MNPKAERLVGIEKQSWIQQDFFDVFKLDEKSDIEYQKQLLTGVLKYQTKR